MGAAPETVIQDFDWQLAEEELLFAEFETQLSEVPNQLHPPESETYGRSLSTIRRLGTFMIEHSALEAISSPEAAQAKVEFYTSVEEGFGTDMELGGGLEVRDFDVRPVIDGQVKAKDLKTAVSSMTEAGLKCAVETAEKDKRFSPQLTRSKWDHENALIVDEMAKGETGYNTRIVISPFPEEAAAQSGNQYWRNIGYVPHLKRGFVQLYHVTEEGGVVLTGSLSFDGSDKQRLREIFSQNSVEIPAGEITDNWLKYAITGTLSEEQARKLATDIADKAGDLAYKKSTNTVDVTKQYQPIMERTFNESYIHICESLVKGKQTDKARELIHQLADKAHHFNKRYASALYEMRATSDRFTDDNSVVLHELLVYSTIEMMRALHLKNTESLQHPTSMHAENEHLMLSHLQSTDPAMFQDMLSSFGATGARNNRTYSACGLSISLGENKESDPQTAYGGNTKDDGNEESSGKKLMSCPFCSAKVFDDPCAKVLSCWDCRATVVNGKVVSKGDGGSKARALARKEAEAARHAAKTAASEQDLTQQVDAVFEERGLEFPPESSEAEPQSVQAAAHAKPLAQLALKD